jgi:tRNA A-37 threonylcarbamoyl transferase component Bud32
VPAPVRPSHFRKQDRRRAVHSFHAEVKRRPARVYLKFYRVRTLKDVAEEVLGGKRARRALLAGLEAERRGIAVPVHVGWSAAAVAGRRPARSVLLTLGVPHNQDARTLLDEALAHGAPERARFLRALGAFVGDAHRRGLVHRDLKLGNVFVVSLEPVAFALLDLDRARFVDPDGKRASPGQVMDLRAMLRSMRKGMTRAERRQFLAAYLRERGFARRARRRLLGLLRVLCAGA